MKIEEMQKNAESATARESQARALMNNPLFLEGRKELRDNLQEAILTTKHDEVALREHYWRMLKTLDDFEQIFVQIMIGGEHARQALDHYKKSSAGYLQSTIG